MCSADTLFPLREAAQTAATALKLNHVISLDPGYLRYQNPTLSELPFLSFTGLNVKSLCNIQSVVETEDRARVKNRRENSFANVGDGVFSSRDTEKG